MHRSGTSLLGSTLETLGLFAGLRKDENNEALFFQGINDWVLFQAGASWDRPLPANALLGKADLMPFLEDYVALLLRSPRLAEYLGMTNYLKWRNVNNIDVPWGWKDPRNSFTLPLWNRVFPDAKIINITRHGVDVAKSLQDRAHAEFKRKTLKYQKLRPFTLLKMSKVNFVDSVRCLDLEGAFSLWIEYTDNIRNLLKTYNPANVLNVRYEHLLEDPKRVLNTACEFTGLKVVTRQIEDAASRYNKGRSMSFRKDDQLLKFAQNHAVELQAEGY